MFRIGANAVRWNQLIVNLEIDIGKSEIEFESSDDL